MPVTLLDYLGIPKPAWMTGLSFLKGEPPVDRQIISVVAGSPTKIQPPFYQVQSVQVQVCQKTYTLNVQTNSWATGTPSGYTAGCDMNLLPSEEEIHQSILDYLEKHGYDVSSLE
jgi:hypothetical protein